jgi:hypothetical protein
MRESRKEKALTRIVAVINVDHLHRLPLNDNEKELQRKECGDIRQEEQGGAILFPPLP